MKRRLIVPIALTATGILVLAVVVAFFGHPTPVTTSTSQVGSSPAQVGSSAATADRSEILTRYSLSTVIAQAHQRLHDDPKDKLTWAAMGLAYVQQGTITGDPTYYPRAEGALDRSLALDPANNWQAMTGLGALANARLDFALALNWARRAAALNAYAGGVYGVMVDALTGLGDEAATAIAVQKMRDREPGMPTSVRASDYFAARGDRSSARRILLRALAESTERSDLALCRYHLGKLTLDEGNPKAALEHYQLGLMLDPESDPLLAGRARAEVALGRRGAALHDYATVTHRTSQPQYLLESAELLLSLGRDDEAEQQFARLAAEHRLRAANGVRTDLTTAVHEADHGSATAAVRHAEAEWALHRSMIVADALGWALHRAGRDRDALGYAIRANRLGRHNATYRYHLGMIEMALGHQAKAHRDLDRALQINPYFSALQAPVARRALVATSELVGSPRGTG